MFRINTDWKDHVYFKTGAVTSRISLLPAVCLRRTVVVKKAESIAEMVYESPRLLQEWYENDQICRNSGMLMTGSVATIWKRQNVSQQFYKQKTPEFVATVV